MKRLPGKLTSDPRTEIVRLITDFCVDLKTAVYGGAKHRKLIQKNRSRYSDFTKEIYRTAPNFVSGPGPREIFAIPDRPKGSSSQVSTRVTSKRRTERDVREVIKRSAKNYKLQPLSTETNMISCPVVKPGSSLTMSISKQSKS